MMGFYGDKTVLGQPCQAVSKSRTGVGGVGHPELAERLKKHGMKETEASIANKTSKGTFQQRFCSRPLLQSRRKRSD